MKQSFGGIGRTQVLGTRPTGLTESLSARVFGSRRVKKMFLNIHTEKDENTVFKPNQHSKSEPCYIPLFYCRCLRLVLFNCALVKHLDHCGAA
jgi:hypothetical protein